MKKIIQKINKKIIHIISTALAFFLRRGIRGFFTQIYQCTASKIYTKEFKKAGKECRIEAPAILIGAKFMEIGECFCAHRNLRMEAYEDIKTPRIVIGNHVCFNYNVHIGCVGEIRIDDNVLIGSNVLITDHNHGTTEWRQLHSPPLERELCFRGKTYIKKNVWIGENVVILGGITIGEGCVIGANAVVNKDIPPYSVVVGNPAKIISINKE